MATGPPILTQNARYAFGSEDSMFRPNLIKHTDKKNIQREPGGNSRGTLKETMGSMLLKM